MIGPAIDPKAKLIPWLTHIRQGPSAYAGKGGVARLYADLEAWRCAQDDIDDMISLGGQNTHPRRHGMTFLLHAAEHFKGYYGSPETRHLYTGNNNWGAWLEQISDSPAQALERFFAWLDIFVEINGVEAKPAKAPINYIDERPFVRVRDVLRPMQKDPSTRPGDGSLQDLQAYLQAMTADKDIRMDEFTRILLSNISAMLAHMGRGRVVSVQDMFTGPMAGGGIDALAQKVNPNGDRWNSYFNAVSRLHSNWRGLGMSQGGVRDLIKG